MRLIFYGKLAETLGRELEFDGAAGSTVGELRSNLDGAFPGNGLADGRIRVCVEGTIVGDDTVLAPDQQVEILAPVSGG